MISYYEDYISTDLLAYLKKQSKPVSGIPGLIEIGTGGGLESKASLQFLCDLYLSVRPTLEKVLTQRKIDREFLDQRTQACFELNKSLRVDFLDPRYQTVIGQEDGHGRVVIGPLSPLFGSAGGGKPIAKIPDYLKGHHVTLFGPPDDPKLSINAMNAFHRKLKNEPAIVGEILKNPTSFPKWGADDEDSKTPLRKDLISAGENLTGCFDKNIQFTDPISKKNYQLESENLSLPIKRFPGLALPSLFLFLNDEPLPLHLYDFALHLFQNWRNPEALCFYVPKLETEEEARYIKQVMLTAEQMIQKIHPDYKVGTIRLLIVLENPRAIFRVNEIMDELFPYFAGASLGWHDYLASTARLFKEDGNYRIPVKADPNIVIKYIKASHSLLSNVVGSRGGIKIGGMYGVLPMENDLISDSFQITIKGFIKDVITQMKRDLSGFWVAHPDFVRIGLALTQAWVDYKKGHRQNLEKLVTSFLKKEHHEEILRFIEGPDLIGLDPKDPLYPRSLLVADIKESTFIPNHHPDEVRYNVFQSLQYLTDWLSGNGCVALPAQIENIPVRVMDDLATAERSRWEVWHEIHHKRFSLDEFLKIAHEEMRFIRKDLSDEKKIVQVKWDNRTEKWYPIAFNLMIKLMTDPEPVEFASELLLPFTVESIRNQEDPWAYALSVDSKKYILNPEIQRFNYYFEVCGSFEFAKAMAGNISLDLEAAEKLIKDFSLEQILEAASYHGDIGENKKTLDSVALKEQALVLKEESSVKSQLRTLGHKYLQKFGFKFLISAKNKTGQELLAKLEERLQNSFEVEVANAQEALWEISKKRFLDHHKKISLSEKIESLLQKHQVRSVQLSLATSEKSTQLMSFGEDVNNSTIFELASLSKTLASAFSVQYFNSKDISLQTSVNSLFEKTDSRFRLSGDFADDVTLENLMNHTALNLHYVNGVPADQEMPPIKDFLEGNTIYDYEPIQVLRKPGTAFQYSGGGFLVLEHLIESLEQKSIQEITADFFQDLNLTNLSFVQKALPGKHYAKGFLSDGEMVQGSRKMFPAFAAGAMGTAEDFLIFLKKLTQAFHDIHVLDPLSHDTAVRLLYATDKGSKKFMKSKMGLGVFTIEAGSNRLMLHQGANDGFRSLFIHCYQGPDQGKGFVALCNADTNGVFFVAEVAQLILKELQISGINSDLFQKDFDLKNISPEQLVNVGYKELIFNAFQPDLPEPIVAKGPRDPLAQYNLAVGGKIIEVSNQGFARAENLLSDHLPIFDPELYGQQGKIMDSWETVRHNQNEFDYLVFELQKPSTLHYVSISTKFHLGNQAQSVRIEGLDVHKNIWKIILPRTELLGHAIKNIKLDVADKTFRQIKVLMYPDGGLTRLGLFGEDLPEAEKKNFLSINQAQNSVFPDSIPAPKKPLTPHFFATKEEIQKNWNLVPLGEEVDVASLAYGAQVLSATNEHYSPATQVISPYPPLNMFDGSESSRSRDRNHFEKVVIGLAKASKLTRIEFDFTYFRNNNPLYLSLEASTESEPDTWHSVLLKTPVKAYAGNSLVVAIKTNIVFKQLKISVFPDGGINRVRAYTKKN